MNDLETTLKPLGGQYQDRYWPLGDEHIRLVEEATGWPLPEDYKTFIGHYGLCQPAMTLAVRRDDEFEAPELEVIFGHFAAEETIYSVVFNANYLQQDGMLPIADSGQGKFLLRSDGSVFFERRGAPMASPDQPSPPLEDTVIADSFSDFLERLYVPD